jgi:hypothetical protein
MKKWLAVYSIAQEKTQLAFGTAIQGLDENCFDLIDHHAIAFRSDKNTDEIHKILVSQCIEPEDEVWILALENKFTGNGNALADLKEFLHP